MPVVFLCFWCRMSSKRGKDNDNDDDDDDNDFDFEVEAEDEDEDNDDKKKRLNKKQKFNVDEFMKTGIHKETSGPTILRMQDYYKIIETVRNYCIQHRVKYEKDFYTSVLTPDENKFIKMYLMTVGLISETDKPKRKKTLTAFVGASKTSTISRIHAHNLIGADHKNPRTRNGASMWKLCMIIFIPDTLRNYISSQVIHKYWDSAHGKGKINRGLFLSKFLGLPCYIPEELKECVYIQNNKFKMPAFVHYDFKPSNVEINQENKKLMVV